MDILFLTWKDLKHPNKWWAEKVVHEYAKWLVAKWYSVTWLSSGFPWWKSEEIIDSIKIVRIYNINTIYFFAFIWYKKYIKTNNVDIIIDEAWWIPFFSPFYGKTKKIFFLVHHIWDKEWDFAFPFPINKIWKFIMKKILQIYKNIPTITVSDSTKNELVKDLWFNENNINVIENALDLKPISEIPFDKKEKSILFLWRLMPMKRVEDAIKAFSEFHKKDPSYILNIVWVEQDKKYTAKLKDLVKSLNLEENILFVWFNTEIFKKYLQISKLMFVSSYKEGFWLIVLEWNAYWIPVVAYNVAWLRDSVKDSKNWYLVADWDYKSMWEKAYEILQNDDNYKNIANSSLEYTKNLESWKDKVDKLERIIS